MNTLITGVAGTGKSSVCTMLREMGNIAYDMDKIPGLCNWENKKTGELGDYHENRNQAWIDKYNWVCDKTKLKQLLKEGNDVIVCGIASNQQELLPLFDTIFLLGLENEIIIQRLSSRTDDHDFAKNESEQLGVLSWKAEWEREMIESGAIQIDANKPLEEVVAYIQGYLD